MANTQGIRPNIYVVAGPNGTGKTTFALEKAIWHCSAD